MSINNTWLESKTNYPKNIKINYPKKNTHCQLNNSTILKNKLENIFDNLWEKNCCNNNIQKSNLNYKKDLFIKQFLILLTEKSCIKNDQHYYDSDCINSPNSILDDCINSPNSFYNLPNSILDKLIKSINELGELGELEKSEKEISKIEIKSEK